MRVDFDCDIYLTGSNAYLLSSELSTYLSGRYVEVGMLPLAFAEYADFCGVSFKPGSVVALDLFGEPVLFDDLFERYLAYGGMPAIASLEVRQAEHAAYMSSIYEAVASRDIVNRERNRRQSRVTNPELLRNVADFLANNIGNQVSASSIANTLTSAGVRTSHPTAASYISALNEAYLFYRVSRYDLHGKAILRTNPKEYIVDLGLRSYLGGYRATDMGRIFENIVYLELCFRGYSVHVGKIYGKEIDFVAVKDGERLYIQVADELPDELTKKRELASLRSLRDAFPKMVIVRKGSYETDVDGIRIVRARDFFLDNWQRVSPSRARCCGTPWAFRSRHRRLRQVLISRLFGGSCGLTSWRRCQPGNGATRSEPGFPTKREGPARRRRRHAMVVEALVPPDAARVVIRIATRVATVYTNAPKRRREAILTDLCTLLRPHGRSNDPRESQQCTQMPQNGSERPFPPICVHSCVIALAVMPTPP